MSRLDVKAAQSQEDVEEEYESEVEREDEYNESDVEFNVDSEPEKDETEEELEHLVFGDSAGFKEWLKSFPQQEATEGTDEQVGTGLEGLDDADLFFTDTAPSRGLTQTSTTALGEHDETIRSKQLAAWEDSDDERMMISLASVPRLRKLRTTEAEDVVNGKEYSRRLRKQFELLNPPPAWAQHALDRFATKRRRLSADRDSQVEDSQDEMDLDDELPSVAPLTKLLQDAESLVRQSGTGTGKKRKLRPEVISIQKLKDVPGIQPSAITSLSFHSKLPLLLSSGPSSTLYLHHISPSPPAPSPNPLLTSMHIRGTALSTTAFHPTDSRIFLSARRRYFHVWDLNTGKVEKVTRVYGQQHDQKTMERFKLSPDGKYMALLGSARKSGGVINILSASTLQWTSQVRIESRGGVADFCWWRDSRGLCIAGKNGEITEWSLSDQRIVARWQDEGAVGTTTIGLGGQHEYSKSSIGTDRWIATGSTSGIVNIYDRRAWLAHPQNGLEQVMPLQPKPTRVFDQLTTPTSNLVFSPDGQLLVMSSKWKKDALRIVHLPSCTLFRNWPTSQTALGRITGVAFAAGEVMGEDLHSVLAVGNEQGKVRLWEIR